MRSLWLAHITAAIAIFFSSTAYAGRIYAAAGAGPLTIASTEKIEPSKTGSVAKIMGVMTGKFAKLHTSLGLGLIYAQASGSNSTYDQLIAQNSFIYDAGVYWGFGRNGTIAVGFGVEGTFGQGALMRYNSPDEFEQLILASARVKLEHSFQKISVLLGVRYARSFNVPSAVYTLPAAEVGFGFRFGRR